MQKAKTINALQAIDALAYIQLQKYFCIAFGNKTLLETPIETYDDDN